MKRGITILLVVLLVGSFLAVAAAQRGSRGQRGGFSNEQGEIMDRGGVPEWAIDRRFKHDVFTFARVRYRSWNDQWRWQKWKTDHPDSDLNFSFRLQQLTTLRVNPDPVIVDLDSPAIFDYPLLYMIEPGEMMPLSEAEIENLRTYLLNGGFLWVDDFWGDSEWYTFYMQLQRVFPDREVIELDITHPIFRTVYELDEMPQVPAINWAWRGRTYERPGTQQVHYRAMLDDQERMMVFIGHNTDLGDGWEREGVEEWYFREFSEKRAYPMGINVVTYAMTH